MRCCALRVTLCVVLHKCTTLSFVHIIRRVGQNNIYTVYIQYVWQGNHQIYGHIRCIYMVLANPNHTSFCAHGHHTHCSGKDLQQLTALFCIEARLYYDLIEKVYRIYTI